VDENEYPHTMNPRMTLGLDFKSPTLVSIKKEKRETDDLGPVQPQPHPLPSIVIKNEARDEDDPAFAPFSNADTNGNYYSQSQQHSYRHQEERDEDLFVPPTQQPSDSAAYRVPLTLQHRPPQHRPQPIEQTSTTTTTSTRASTSPDRDEDWGVDRTESEDKRERRLKRSRSRSWRDSGDEEGEGGSGEEDDDEPVRTKRGREHKDNEEGPFEYKTEPRGEVEEEEPLQKYEVMVGCTPDVRPGGGAGVSAATPYFWQAGATTATASTIKIEERSFGGDDRGGEYQDGGGDEAERRRHANEDSDVDRGAEAAADADVKQQEEEKEEEEEEEEESEGSGHSAIIQQLLQKNKAGNTGQVSSSDHPLSVVCRASVADD
jgi:hypothetical protein